MKLSSSVLLSALAAAVFSSCADPSARDSAAPDRSAQVLELPPVRATDLYRRAVAEACDGRVGKALDLLMQARRLDPRSSEIRELYDKLVLAASHPEPRWFCASGVAIVHPSDSLAGVRAAVAASAEQLEAAICRRDWRGAAEISERSSKIARSIPALAIAASGGRLGDAWSRHGEEAMQRGEFAAAAVCFELARTALPAEVAAGNSARKEALRLRADECRRLESPPAQRSASRRPTPSSEKPPEDYRRRMTAAILELSRARILVGESAEAARAVNLVCRLDPNSGGAQRLARALPALQEWDPFASVDTPSARQQQDLTRALGCCRAAKELEDRGQFADSANVYAGAAEALLWMPFTPDLKSLAADAQAGATRCRRLAEDASR